MSDHPYDDPDLATIAYMVGVHDARADISRLRALADQMAEALRPFARKKPCNWYAEDGSDLEKYSIVLGVRRAKPADLTGADLANARAALEAYERMK